MTALSSEQADGGDGVTIITAIYGGYDSLKPVPEQTFNGEIDLVVVTDDPGLEVPGWRVYYEPRPGMSRNLAGKRPKMLPWLYTANRRSIWIDASFRVVSPNFVEQVLEYLPFGVFTHPDRDCIYDEARYSRTMPKYDNEALEVQVAHYRAEGHPEHYGLWNGGLIVREHTECVKQIGTRWLSHCYRFTVQDQVSLPVVLRELGTKPVPIPGSPLANAWLRYEGSARHG